MDEATNQLIALSRGVTMFWVLIGILISLVLPLAVKTLRKAQSQLESVTPSFGQRVAKAWVEYGGNRYLAVLMAALVVAVVVVFLLGLEFFKTRDAALAGFAWESLVSKLFSRQQE